MEAPNRTPSSNQPGFFPILPWSPLRGWEEPYQDPKHGLQSIAGCGFTMAGFVQPRDLAACARLGLKAIVAPPRRPRYMGAEWRTLGEEGRLDARVREWVAETEATEGGECVMGYFIMDEPGAETFPVLREVFAAFRRHAPDKLAYLNLYPNYATIATFDESGQAQKSQLQTATYAEYLERYVSETQPQFLSYDNYMVLYSEDMRDPEKAALYFRNLIEVRDVALKHGIPWWQVVCSNQIRPHTPVPSPANLALQAWTTLAAGGVGVGWFTYYGLSYGYAPIDGTTGLRTPTWSALRAVNEELRAIGPLMNGLRSTGVYVAVPDGQEAWGSMGLAALPGRLIESVEAPSPVMVGEFRDAAGGEYVALVNLSLERSAKVAPVPASGKRVVARASVDDGSLDPFDAPGGVWLNAGQGALLRIG